MEYLALLVPALTLAGLPLLDRLERWATSRPPVPDQPADSAAGVPVHGDGG